MDVVEEVDALLDGVKGAVVSVDVSGSIQCPCHLSGVPDLLLTFKEPDLLDNNCSFHPCVRCQIFDRDQVVSFVPPDGDFELMRYRLRPTVVRDFVPPLYCHAQWKYNNNNDTTTKMAQSNQTLSSSSSSNDKAAGRTGQLTIQLGVNAMTQLIHSASANRGRKGTELEEVTVLIPFPKSTVSTSTLAPNVGTITWEEAGQRALWRIGTMDRMTRATLSCSFTLAAASKKAKLSQPSIIASVNDDNHHHHHHVDDEVKPNLSIHWLIPLASVSGLSVSGLSIRNETYRPYKGVRNITQSGRFQVRCS